jgi:hypothetical protein
MSKRKITDVNPEAVRKDDAKQKHKKIREGQGNSSFWSDREKPDKNEYPRKHTAEKQYDNEPEFKDRIAMILMKDNILRLNG